jgi:hypothetical protein
MIKVTVELERPIGDPFPLYTLTIEDKDLMYPIIKSDGMRASEVEQVALDIMKRLRTERNHCRWLLER